MSRSPSSALLLFFFFKDFPTEINHKKRGTLILTIQVEDLGVKEVSLCPSDCVDVTPGELWRPIFLCDGRGCASGKRGWVGPAHIHVSKKLGERIQVSPVEHCVLHEIYCIEVPPLPLLHHSVKRVVCTNPP